MINTSVKVLPEGNDISDYNKKHSYVQFLLETLKMTKFIWSTFYISANIFQIKTMNVKILQERMNLPCISYEQKSQISKIYRHDR